MKIHLYLYWGTVTNLLTEKYTPIKKAAMLQCGTFLQIKSFH
jgi:hypothetical protein